jgi:hypothetical protein
LCCWKLVERKWQYIESDSCSRIYGVVLFVVSIWTLTPHGVSASVSAQLQSGWVGIPFWKRRHLFLTIEKRHCAVVVAWD